MLSVSGASNSGYYTNLAQVGYYTEAPEKPGQWCGRGADKLKLQGQINPQELTNLFQGFSPDGKSNLTQNAGDPKRRNAYDLTFSAPKSFSVLWAIGKEEDRAKLESIEERAIKTTLDEAQNYIITRTGKAGINREHCELVFAQFPHSTSRAEEPNRHTHCLLMNIGVREDGQTSALDVSDLYRMKMTLGAIYRSELTRMLKEEMLLESERVNRSIELVGRNSELCEHWSSRAKEIDKHMAEHGLSGAEAAAKVCLKTRKTKDMLTPQTEYLKAWSKEAESRGVTYQSLLDDMQQEAQKIAPRDREQQIKEVREKALHRLFSEQSHFTQFKLYQTVAEEAQISGLTLTDIKSIRDDIKQNECKNLHNQKNGVQHYTTKRTYQLEEDFLKNIKKLSDSNSHHINAKTRLSCLTEKFSDEQKLAYLHVTNTGQLKIVEGLAGTGKTTFLRQANEAWLKDDYKTFGVSLSAVAAENLSKEAGIKHSSSLAKFFMEYERQQDFDAQKLEREKSQKDREIQTLHFAESRELSRAKTKELLERLTKHSEPTTPEEHQALEAKGEITHKHRQYLDYAYQIEERRIDDKTVIVLDEAAMVGTQDLKRLTDICQETGAKTVWVGDRAQLQAIDPGGAFGGAADRVGHEELNQIWRQRGDHEWAREAVYNAAKGEVGEALIQLEANGKIEFATTKHEARELLIEAWQQGKTDDLKETLILTSTREEAATLNGLAQEVLISEGKIDPLSQSVESGGMTYYEGDRLMFEKNNRELDVKNGQRGEIEEVTPQGNITVKLDNGEYRHVDPEAYKEFSLAYACTTHKAQGQTVSGTFIMVDDSMIDREAFYVQISRQRDDLQLFVTSEMPAREDAMKEFLSKVGHSNKEVLAHDLAKHLQETEAENQRNAALRREVEDKKEEYRQEKHFPQKQSPKEEQQTAIKQEPIEPEEQKTDIKPEPKEQERDHERQATPIELALFGEGTSKLDHETQQRRMEVYQHVVETQTEDLKERLSQAETQADKDRAYKQFNEAISKPIPLSAELDDRDRYFRDFKQGLESIHDSQTHGKKQEQDEQQAVKQSEREEKQKQREEIRQEPSREEKIQQLETKLLQVEQKLVEIQKQEEKQQQQHRHGYSY